MCDWSNINTTHSVLRGSFNRKRKKEEKKRSAEKNKVRKDGFCSKVHPSTNKKCAEQKEGKRAKEGEEARQKKESSASRRLPNIRGVGCKGGSHVSAASPCLRIGREFQKATGKNGRGEKWAGMVSRRFKDRQHSAPQLGGPGGSGERKGGWVQVKTMGRETKKIQFRGGNATS